MARKQPAALARYWAARRGKSSGSTSIVVVPGGSSKRKRRSGGGKRKHHRRHRRHGGGSGMPRLLPLALATAGLAYVTNDSGPKFITENVAKIPGAKTFGGTTMAGLAALAVDRFVKPNKWLKLFGLAGVVLGAAQVGKQGTNFKWVGDEESGDFDLADDMGGDDDVGDDE